MAKVRIPCAFQRAKSVDPQTCSPHLLFFEQDAYETCLPLTHICFIRHALDTRSFVLRHELATHSVILYNIR